MSITQTQYREALRLADAMGRHVIVNSNPNIKLPADELRRQHAAIAHELLFQLTAAANYIDRLGGDSKRYRIAIAKVEGGAV